VLALLERAAVVMLDLREYTAVHAGTRYEIFQIMNVAPIEKVICSSASGRRAGHRRRAAHGVERDARDLTQSARHRARDPSAAHAHARRAEIRSLFAAVASVASA